MILKLSLKARDLLDESYGNKYSVALNLVPDTPEWLAGYWR